VVDAAVGAAASANAPAAKESAAPVPAVCVKAAAGYAEKADGLPVTLIDGPAQPAPKAHGAVAHAGQLAASPNVVCSAPSPVAVHAAVVMSEHALAPATDEDPKAHAVGADEPAAQKEPAGHAFVVPTAWPAAQ